MAEKNMSGTRAGPELFIDVSFEHWRVRLRQELPACAIGVFFDGNVRA
jgi:hypothetical protein